jgi:K+-transporting ATPase ATPase C chain
MRRQLRAAAGVFAVLTVVTGLLYPLAVLAFGQAAFADQANGSLVRVHGRVVGSSLLAQGFTRPGYFHPRPSSGGYDASASGASNLGPSSPALTRAIRSRVAAYRRENGLSGRVSVPVDAVTTSGSGLDPDISVANARLQAPRVARARRLRVARVLALVATHVDGRDLGVLGEARVNVLDLNLALDHLR